MTLPSGKLSEESKRVFLEAVRIKRQNEELEFFDRLLASRGVVPYTVVGWTGDWTLRLHVPGSRLSSAGVDRNLELHLPSTVALDDGDPWCVAHEDCASSPELGRACWAERRTR